MDVFQAIPVPKWPESSLDPSVHIVNPGYSVIASISAFSKLEIVILSENRRSLTRLASSNPLEESNLS